LNDALFKSPESIQKEKLDAESGRNLLLAQIRKRHACMQPGVYE